MKSLTKFKYPKLLLLVLSIILAYYLFSIPQVSDWFANLGSLSYIGVFIAGMLFAFGFSAAFAVGFFLTLNPSNIFIAAIIAGFGALISDLIILNFIRISFQGEFNKLKKTNTIKEISNTLNQGFLKKTKIYLMYAFAGILIASPLPDEAGVTLLAGLTKIKQSAIAIIGFILNTLGILIILAL